MLDIYVERRAMFVALLHINQPMLPSQVRVMGFMGLGLLFDLPMCW